MPAHDDRGIFEFMNLVVLAKVWSSPNQHETTAVNFRISSHSFTADSEHAIGVGMAAGKFGEIDKETMQTMLSASAWPFCRGISWVWSAACQFPPWPFSRWNFSGVVSFTRSAHEHNLLYSTITLPDLPTYTVQPLQKSSLLTSLLPLYSPTFPPFCLPQLVTLICK